MNLRFDRWDFLATKALLLVLAVGICLAAVVVPLLAWVRGRALTWTGNTGVSPVVRDDTLTPAPGARMVWTGDASVTLADPATHVWLASLAPGVVLALVAVSVAALLLGLVRRIERGEAFVAASARALRLVALTLLTGVIALVPIGGLADNVVMNAARTVNGPTTFTLATAGQLVTMAVALLLAALAEAFSHGERLQHDVDGLV